MTFSYNLVLALFLLAPGFAAYAGLFFTSHRDGRLHPAPPAPGSVLTLALVTLAALVLHGVWALLLAVQAWWGETHVLLPVPFEPNIYLDLLAAEHAPTADAAAQLSAGHTAAPHNLSGGDIAAALWTLIILTVAGYVLTAWLVTSKFADENLRGFLYGWAADLVDQIQVDDPGHLRLVTAFVLTQIDHGGAAFGYEGLLLNMALNADKEITSITLSEVTAFYVNLAPGQFKRVVLPNTAGIPNLYLEKSEIRNVAFQVFRVPAPSPDQLARSASA